LLSRIEIPAEISQRFSGRTALTGLDFTNTLSMMDSHAAKKCFIKSRSLLRFDLTQEVLIFARQRGYWDWSVRDISAEPLFQELTHKVRLRRLYGVELPAEVLQFGARCLGDASRNDLRLHAMVQEEYLDDPPIVIW